MSSSDRHFCFCRKAATVYINSALKPKRASPTVLQITINLGDINLRGTTDNLRQQFVGGEVRSHFRDKCSVALYKYFEMV